MQIEALIVNNAIGRVFRTIQHAAQKQRPLECVGKPAPQGARALVVVLAVVMLQALEHRYMGTEQPLMDRGTPSQAGSMFQPLEKGILVFIKGALSIRHMAIPKDAPKH